MRGRKYKVIFMVAVLLTISIASLSLNKMIVNASSNKPGTMKVKVLSKSDRTAEIPAPAVVQTRSYQVITGYTVYATIEQVIVGYEQECACGKVQDKN